MNAPRGDDLARIQARMKALARLESEIRRERAELEKLRVAILELRAKTDGAPPTAKPSASARPLLRENSVTAAVAVLTANDPRQEGMGYKEITRIARDLGWKGADTSLRRRMLKRPDLFRPLGEGKYALR